MTPKRCIEKLTLCAVALLCMLEFAAAEAEKAEASPSFFPIMAWDWNYDDWNYFAKSPGHRLEQLKMMKDCGFTIAGLFRESDLQTVEDAGMKAFLIDPRITYDWVGWLKGEKLQIDEAEARRKIEDLVADAKGREVIYGYYVVDEPGFEVLPQVKTIVGLLRESDPERIRYVNLHPNYAPPKYIAGDYDKYLREYSESGSPNLLSVDNYYLMRPDERFNPELAAQFYVNMAKMRDASLKVNVPFWSVLLSMPHQTYVNITRGNMARQVYASLAYGAKGLSYFCYFQNRSPDATSAPIDREGKKTPIWDIVSDLNHEVLALAPILNRLTIQRNYFLGDVPNGSEAPPGDALVTTSPRKDQPRLLVGEFMHENGDRYAMVVNTDPRREVSGTLLFPATKDPVQRIQPVSGTTEMPTNGDFALRPGEGMLLRICPK
jgi:hypothetical protein